MRMEEWDYRLYGEEIAGEKRREMRERE